MTQSIRLKVTLALTALLGACATLQPNIQRSQLADRCYAERAYPDLIAADGCTERDIFNGQQQAQNQERLQASWQQLAELAAQQRQQQEAMAMSTPAIQPRPYVPLPAVQLVPPSTPLKIATAPTPPIQCFTDSTGNQSTTTCYP